MECLSTETLFPGAFLSMYKRRYRHKDREGDYFMVSRSKSPPSASSKHPDAVIVIGFLKMPEGPKLVLTKEFRVPVGCYELGFVAGLIDPKDAESGSYDDAIKKAATREFKEETGLEFEPREMSPYNLYSSGGMSDESVCVVFGVAEGTPSQEYLEPSEEIEMMAVDREQIKRLLTDPSLTVKATPRVEFSKIGWPLLWAFDLFGFPKHLCE